MAKATGSIVQRLKEYFGHLARGGDMYAQALFALAGSRIMELGGPIVAPTTASTQATGAGGALAWRANYTWMLVCIDGVVGEIQPAADFVVFAGASPVPSGSAVTATLIVKRAAGVFTVYPVLGVVTVGTTAPPPTDAAIAAALATAFPGVPQDWVKLGDVTLARTSDLVLAAPVNVMTGCNLGLVLNTPGVL